MLACHHLLQRIVRVSKGVHLKYEREDGFSAPQQCSIKVIYGPVRLGLRINYWAAEDEERGDHDPVLSTAFLFRLFFTFQLLEKWATLESQHWERSRYDWSSAQVGAEGGCSSQAGSHCPLPSLVLRNRQPPGGSSLLRASTGGGLLPPSSFLHPFFHLSAWIPLTILMIISQQGQMNNTLT